MRWLPVLTFLIACGSKATAPSTPAAPSKLPEETPLATVGERMSYRLSLSGVELAAFDVGFPAVQDLGGTKALVMQSQARSVGLVRAFAKIDDRFTSWIDVRNGRSLRFQSDEAESKDSERIEHVTIDFNARNGDVIPVMVALDDAEPKAESQRVNLPLAWDLNSFLLALRTWEAPAGSTALVEVFRSRYLWAIELRASGKENLVTELGELPALRFEARTFRLDRQGKRVPKREREFTIWVSNDAGRVPLEIIARTDYGEIRMKIVDYDPGSGERVAP